MSNPKLSVLMANYNHGRYLVDSLPAILGQSYKHTEIIVIDDGSTDDSVRILEGFARSSPNFRFIQNDRNRGAIYSANRILKEAKGEYLCFCSADDRVLPDFFRASMSLLEEHADAGACTALVRVMGADGNDQGLFRPFKAANEKCFISPACAADILRRRGTWYMGPATIFRREAFVAAGGLIPELGAMCDDFLFMVLALRYGVCHIPEPLAVWRRMEGTYSSAASADLVAARKIVDHAASLVRTTYRDIFPAPLVSRLEGRWQFSLGVRGVAKSCRGRVADVEALLPAKVIPGVFRSFLFGAIDIYRWAATLILFIRFRPGDIIDLLGRRSRSFFELDERFAASVSKNVA